MKKLPKKYDIRNVIYNYSSGETTIRLTIPQKDIEKSLKETQYSKHKWGSIDIRLIYKNGRPNFAYIPQEPEFDTIKKEEVIKQLLELDTDDYKITRSCNGKMYISIGVDEDALRKILIDSIYKSESEEEE